MDTLKLRDRTVEFLRRYGHLDDPVRGPDFRDEDFPGYCSPLADAYPWYRSDPLHYRPPRTGDEVYEGNYNAMQSGIPVILYRDFEKLASERIPDSEEFVVIDIGSGLGRRTTRVLARAKPNIRVYMVDKLTKEEVEEPDNYEAVERNDIAGEELKVKLPVGGNVEASINEILQANGYRNITYMHRELVPVGLEETNFSDIEDLLRTRKVVFTGYMKPKGLGNITASEGIYHNAELLLLNNTALEKIPPDSVYFDLMGGFLADCMSKAETSKVVSLIHDPEYKSRNPGEFKYDCETSERLFAIALKQLFVLAQVDFLEKNGMNVTLRLEKMPYGPGHYNSPDHDIEAVRKN